MAKCIFRLICILTILFLAVPLLASLGAEHTYSLPLGCEYVILQMPDGETKTVTWEEYFIGTAAAFMPNEANEEALKAAFVMLNTPELTKNGVMYLSEEARLSLWGDKCKEKNTLYLEILGTVNGQSIIPASDTDISLFDCMESLQYCEGDYTEILAALFPGGALKTEK